MLGVQLGELAFIGRSFWWLGLMIAGAVSVSNTAPEVDTLELIRQVQKLRVQIMMAFTMDLVFRRMNPLWWIWFAVYSMLAWAWHAFKWFFLLDWWQPTTFIGKVLKWPIVAWVNVPLSLPATFAYLAIVAGMDPTVIPFVTPEVGAVVTAFVNK